MIELYLAFAISTAIIALVFAFNPILRKAQALGIENPFTDNPLLTRVVYLIISALIAPVLVLPLLVPSMNTRFIAALEKSLLEP